VSKLGCTNHGCVFREPGGVGTNSICQCVLNLIRKKSPHMAANEITRELQDRNNRLRTIEAQHEQLKKAAREYVLLVKGPKITTNDAVTKFDALKDALEEN